MSGICGIVNPEGLPVDGDLLWRMTRSMAFRGPDAQEIWIGAGTGFGHAQLRTTREAENEEQPCTIDGNAWIVADCRIDARQELIGQLRSAGRQISETVTDPELILHSYAVWDTACISRLIGDFAFAIRDVARQRLFCARDHLGVKPFYYSQLGGNGLGSTFVFGNTLNTLRLHPEVTARLNDLAISDYLIFGHNQDPGTTAFADIRRLPRLTLCC